MATGDQADFLARIKDTLPGRWFADETPILDGVLSGPAYACAWSYSMLAFVRAQARRLTATDIYLDLIAADFFGTFLKRHTNETDAALSGRIGRELFREKSTRAGLIAALVDLTGRTPKVFEPAYPFDTGAYNVGTLGYNVAGGYGSLDLPFQFFVTAYRPAGSGVASVAGYNTLASTAGLSGPYSQNGDSTTATSTAVPAMVPRAVVTKCTIQAGNKAACLMATALTVGQTYTASVWVWVPSSSSFSTMAFQGEGGITGAATVVAANLSTTNAWQRIAGSFTATATSTNLVLRVNSFTPNIVVYAALMRLDPTNSGLIAPGGYGAGAIEYVSTAMISGQVTDADIYETVNNVRPVASIGWTAISN